MKRDMRMTNTISLLTDNILVLQLNSYVFVNGGETPHHQFPLPLSIALVLCAFALVYSLIAFTEGPSSLLTALAKSGFTAAFSLIFVSELADKTFFIAALLAMQHELIMVLLGSMGALTIKTIVSIAMGRIFQCVPAQFRTSTRIHFLQSIREAWKLPTNSG